MEDRRMKCVVFAYHNIGCAGVEALLKNGYEIAAIFTHKDNPQENIWFDSVAELGCRYGIPIFSGIQNSGLSAAFGIWRWRG